LKDRGKWHPNTLQSHLEKMLKAKLEKILRNRKQKIFLSTKPRINEIKTEFSVFSLV